MHETYILTSLEELEGITSADPEIHLLVLQAKDQIKKGCLDYETIVYPFIVAFCSLKKVPLFVFDVLKLSLEINKIPQKIFPQLKKVILEKNMKEPKAMQLSVLLTYKLSGDDLLSLFKYVSSIKSVESEMVTKQMASIVFNRLNHTTNENSLLNNEFSKEELTNDCIAIFKAALSLNDLELLALCLQAQESANILDFSEVLPLLKKRIKINTKECLNVILKAKPSKEIDKLIYSVLQEKEYKSICNFLLEYNLEGLNLTKITEYVLTGTVYDNSKETDEVSNLDYFIGMYKNVRYCKLVYNSALLRKLLKYNLASFIVLYVRVADNPEFITHILKLIPNSEMYYVYYTILINLNERMAIDILEEVPDLKKITNVFSDYSYLTEKSADLSVHSVLALLDTLENEFLKMIYLKNIDRIIDQNYNIFEKLEDFETIKEYYKHCKSATKETELLPLPTLKKLINEDPNEGLNCLEHILKYDNGSKHIYTAILALLTEIKEKVDISQTISYIINEMLVFIGENEKILQLIDFLQNLKIYREMADFLIRYQQKEYYKAFLDILINYKGEEEDIIALSFYFICKTESNYEIIREFLRTSTKKLYIVRQLNSVFIPELVNDYLKFISNELTVELFEEEDSVLLLECLEGLKVIVREKREFSFKTTNQTDNYMQIITAKINTSFSTEIYNTLLALLTANICIFINKILDSENGEPKLDRKLILKVLYEHPLTEFDDKMLLSLRLITENEDFFEFINYNARKIDNPLFENLINGLSQFKANKSKSIDTLILLTKHNSEKIEQIRQLALEIYKLDDEFLILQFFHTLNDQYTDLFFKFIKDNKYLPLVIHSFDKIYQSNFEEARKAASFILNDYVRKFKIHNNLVDRKDQFLARHVLKKVKNREMLMQMKDEIILLMKNRCFLTELEDVFWIMLNE